jgi:gliding motility-associated-like protein
MKKRFTISLVIFFAVFTVRSYAQMESTNNAPFTPENLITNIFLGEGVEVISVQYDGEPNAVAFFKEGQDAINIDRGLVMSTGNASTDSGTIGVENVGGTQASSGTSGSSIFDADMNELAGINGTMDIARYTITFIPISDTLRFNYVFASEEYPEYACTTFNDIFGFFISGPGINGPYENNAENIAIIPGTDLPVTINNVNPGVPGTSGGTVANCSPPLGSLDYSAFYNDNNGSANQPVFDGFLDVFTAEAVVMPCSTYTIKLVIADVGDGAFDSGVFLEAKSFGTGSLDVEATTVSLDGTVAEGCSEGVLNFILPIPTESDLPIDYTIFGTAENGVDYQFIPEDLFIPAGDSIVSVPIIAFEDNIAEGTETIMIDIQRDPCNRDTIIIPIKDSPLVDADLGVDINISEGESVQLDGTLNVPLPPPLTFTNDTPLSVSPAQTTIYSDLDVFGVLPAFLTEGVIESVCIDDLQTTWVDDLKMYLLSPGGQFIELVTDIGNPGDNFINTCFTPEATTPITDVTIADQPFTGEFQPEGIWTDLYGPTNPTNGTWQLSLFDKFAADVPLLNSWSITFSPIYEISYSWQPADGLSCSDCPDPIATPDTTTNYILTATDSYGCTTTDSILITVTPCVPPVLDMIGTTDVSCYNGADGSVTISATGGILPYTYNLDGEVNSTGTFNGLAAGSYQVQVIDSTGCPLTTPFTILQPDSIEASLVKEDVSCFGAADGNATFEITGGNGPYNFDWSDGQTDSVAINLAGGSIGLEITDASGCSFSYTVDIEEPAILEATVAVDSVNCRGDNDGTALISPEGGVSPYTFTFNPVVNQGANPGEAIDLSRGTYAYTVTDANNCIYEDNFEVEEPEELEVQLDITDALCADSTSGNTIATVTGGVGNYTYSWTDDMANLIGEDPQQNDMGAGFYLLEVRDENGCLASESFEVLEPLPITYTLDVQPASCNGLADGVAEVAPGGGTGMYGFEWSDIGTAPGNRNDLTGGDYSVTIADENNCTLVVPFEIESPESIVLSFDSTGISCNDSTDGTATVTPEGGTAPYVFNWEDGQDTPMAAMLPAGEISVTVTDVNGCEAIGSVMVNTIEALAIELDGTDVSCFDGSDGSITASGTGGAGGYTFEWSDGQNGPVATGLVAGTYTVSMVDANSCTTETTLEIFEPTVLSSSTDSEEASCLPDPDGMASVMVEGGVAPYQYEWSNGQMTATIGNLTEGTYFVTITDANNCLLTDTVLVDAIPSIELTASSQPVSCNGGNDGQGVIMATGGAGSYSYNWGNGLPDSQSQNALMGTTYIVTVTDAIGCMATIAVVVEEPSELSLSTDIGMIRCSGGSDGMVEVLVAGGTAPYTYNWSNGASTSSISGLGLGTYSVTVEDANGCLASTSAAVEEASPINVSIEVEDVKCFGDRTGVAGVNVNGGLPPYSYQWSNGDIGNEISNVLAGEYTVSITDAAGCEVTEELFIPQPDGPVDAVVEVTDVSCFGEQDGRIEISAQGGTAPYRYSIDGDFYSGSSTFLGLSADAYGVLVQDSEGCTYLLDAVQVLEPDPIVVDLGDDRSINFGDTIRLVPEIMGGVGAFGYDWFPQDSTLLDCFECSGPLISPSFQVSYRVIVTDETGCTGEDLVTIYAKKNRPVLVPTGFTPNGDGNNDLLMVLARSDIRLTIEHFRIFDRWGELVFEARDFQPNDPAFGWDGLFRGEELNDGVFIWDIQVEYVDGLKETFQGHTTLIR